MFASFLAHVSYSLSQNKKYFLTCRLSQYIVQLKSVFFSCCCPMTCGFFCPKPSCDDAVYARPKNIIIKNILR